MDVSSIGIRWSIKDLPKIARESGVNIITGTGYYVDFTVPEEAKMMTVQEVRIYIYIICSTRSGNIRIKKSACICAILVHT